MSFLNELEARNPDSISRLIADSGTSDVERAIVADSLGENDFLALLSPAAAGMMERIAQHAHEVTLRHFGRTVELFTPLYLSNYCVNGCVYCGFNARNGIPRGRLTYEEAGREGEFIAATGLRHVLLLTGESPVESPVGYIAECVSRLRERFDSVSVEVYPLDAEGYERLVTAGCDGVTLFQETYDRTLYGEVHPSGPKRDFKWRLDAPERACAAGMRTVSIGALLGLGPWQREVFMTGLHAAWLQKNYPGVSIGISLPRMRPHAGCYDPSNASYASFPVNDREFVQILL
ncbi:MAG TPA: radical SAM protein, partial [Spirochaetota bacterium]|nr:radical SAM protein [Spirochaetota bacterium]